jgi:NAD(P)-dependent dehydrogenase (short-subunit alcohol dehydrogenase family)
LADAIRTIIRATNKQGGTNMGARLKGKVAAITGGASGMGKATAKRFLQEGAKVAIGDLNAEVGAEAMAEFDALGLAGSAVFVPMDASVEEDVARLVETAVDEFGRLDCMFNNAGIGGALGRITEIHAEDWDHTFAVLVRGVFLGVKHGARVMKAQDGGSIINTGSVAGLGGGAGPTAYSAAKAAVMNLTKAAAVELAEDRIRINAIAPGIIRTPLFHAGKPEKAEAIVKDKTPWPRLGEGEDIANAALYLASDESEYMTGQTMVVDGGILAQGPGIFGASDDNVFLRRTGITYGSTGKAPDWHLEEPA